MSTIFRISPDTISMTKSILTEMESWNQTVTVEDTYSIDDTTSFDLTADARDLIKLFFGNTAWSMEPINSLSLTDNGYLLCSDYFTVWDGFDETEILNDSYSFDETTVSFADTDHASALFTAMSGLTITSVPLDRIVLDPYKNAVGAKEFKENQTL